MRPLSAWADPPVNLVLPAGLTAYAEVAASTANLGPGFDALGLAVGLRNEVLSIWSSPPSTVVWR